MQAKKITLCVILTFTFCLMSCAYQFQDSHNPLKSMEIERIYVVNFENMTFRPGVEQAFTTAMVREIEKSNSLKLVSSEKSADAILTGKVMSADTAVSSTRATQIDAIKQVSVATEYYSNVTCLVTLKDRFGREIFSQSINSSKTYPGAVCSPSSSIICLADQSSTIGLTNESEQRMAIDFLATQMMASMFQRMISVF